MNSRRDFLQKLTVSAIVYLFYPVRFGRHLKDFTISLMMARYCV